MDNVREAGVFDPTFQPRPWTGLAIQLRPCCIDEKLDPLQEVVLVGDGAVFGIVEKIIVLEFGPGAWIQVPSDD